MYNKNAGTQLPFTWAMLSSGVVWGKSRWVWSYVAMVINLLQPVSNNSRHTTPLTLLWATVQYCITLLRGKAFSAFKFDRVVYKELFPMWKHTCIIHSLNHNKWLCPWDRYKDWWFYPQFYRHRFHQAMSLHLYRPLLEMNHTNTHTHTCTLPHTVYLPGSCCGCCEEETGGLWWEQLLQGVDQSPVQRAVCSYVVDHALELQMALNDVVVHIIYKHLVWLIQLLLSA